MGVGMELFRVSSGSYGAKWDVRVIVLCVFQMCLYLSFPATLFYIANQPDWFQKNVTAMFEKEAKMMRTPTVSSSFIEI